VNEAPPAREVSADTSTDVLLEQAAFAASPELTTELWRRFHPFAVRCARKFALPSDVDDVAHEALLRAIGHASTLRKKDQATFQAFIRQCCANRATDFMRAKKDHSELSESPMLDEDMADRMWQVGAIKELAAGVGI